MLLIPFVILTSALFEEDFSQDLFLLLVRVIVLNVVVARSVEDRVVVVVTVRVPVSYLLVN